jgi:hypothetical protein
VSSWPSAKVVQGALKGIREVFTTEKGTVVAGIRSNKPWILAPVGPEQAAVVCERCATGYKFPDIPKGNDKPLFGPQTKDYALYVLARLLNPFYAEHEACAMKAQEAS